MFGELVARDLGSRLEVPEIAMSAHTLRSALRAWHAAWPHFDINTGLTSEATSETIQRTKKSLRNAVA